MKSVTKLSTPNFFTQDTAGLTNWNGYLAENKRTLKKYILDNEQGSLCIYCESNVRVENTHLEHIKPKSFNKYPEFTFTYANIAASCEGDLHSEDDGSKETCGHKKDDEYCHIRFIDPTLTPGIRDYFEYDFDDKNVINIKCSGKDPNRAEYMISVLKLNEGALPKARKKMLDSFIKKIATFQDKDLRKQKIKKIINMNSIAFVSMLNSKYKNLV